MNPVVLIRQKSKFIRKEASQPAIRRLSYLQWQTVIHLAKEQAKDDMKHERTIFILSCLYSMYLRISELVADKRWSPTMGDNESFNQVNIINTRIHTVTSNLLKKETHPQILGNVLFSNWLRLSTLSNYVSESYYQKMEHYFSEIIKSARKKIPSLFQGSL